MEKIKSIVLIVLLIGAVFSGTANAVADRLIFPVLADNHSIAQNSADPRDYGWFVNNGFGNRYVGNPVGGHLNPPREYHPAEDWNRTDGRDNNGNESVYSIGDGVIARIERNHSFYGGTILVRYELTQEMDFTPYFLPNTTPVEQYRRDRHIIAQFMHIAVDGNLQEGQWVNLGQRLGVILNTYNNIVFQHLHFEIMVDPNGNSFATTARNGIGYYENQQLITKDGYIDPTRFILGYNTSQSTTNLVGKYPDSSLNQLILNYYTANGGESVFGHPFDNNSGTAFVHRWPEQGTEYVIIQDFAGGIYGTDKQCAIVYNPNVNSAFLLKEGFFIS